MRCAARCLAAARIMLAGAGGAVTASFAVLVLVCVSVAVAAPRQDAGFRTRALQQAFAAAPTSQKTVVADADWAQFVASVHRRPLLGTPAASIPPVTREPLGAARNELASAIAAIPLPLSPRSADWYSMTTSFTPLTRAARSATSALLPRMELVYRDVLAAHCRLVSGRLPALSRHRPAARGRGASLALEVAVTQATAARFGLHPGSRMPEADGVTLVVTGIIRPADPSSAFWTNDRYAAVPFLKLGRFGDPQYWMGGAFVGAGEIADLQEEFGSAAIDLTWVFPLALGKVTADAAATLSSELNRAVNESASGLGGFASGMPVPLGTVVLSSDMIPLLATFLDAQGAVQALLTLLYTSLAMLSAVVLLLGARLLAERRAGELTLMRARGASLSQVAALATGGGALAALPAAVAGAAIAIALPGGRATPLAWWLGAVTVAVPLAGLPVIVAWRHRRVSPASEPLAASAARARRWVAEAAVAAAAVSTLVTLRQQGGAGGATLYTAAPVLLAAPVALVVIRLYPAVLRAGLRLVGPRAGAAVFVGLATAARTAAAMALPAFALVLALALAAFGGTVRAAVLRGEVASSWQSMGADARIDLPGESVVEVAAARRAVAATAGVGHSTTVVATDALSPGGTDIPAFGVDPAEYARLTADTPLPRVNAALLARRSGRTGPVPALASPAAVSALGAGRAMLGLDTGRLPVRIVGTVTSTPALPGGGAFVLLPRWALRSEGPPNLILVSGHSLAGPRLTAALHRLAPGAVVTLRSAVLTGLTRAPLQQGAYAVFAAGIVAAGGLSVAVLLFSLALGARSRDLTIAWLAAMGLSRAQSRVLVAIETVPPVLAAATAGAACAWVLAPLMRPALHLSVFTGSGQPVAVRADVVAATLPAVGLAGLCLATLAAQTAIMSGRRAGQLRRAGE